MMEYDLRRRYRRSDDNKRCSRCKRFSGGGFIGSCSMRTRIGATDEMNVVNVGANSICDSFVPRRTDV